MVDFFDELAEPLLADDLDELAFAVVLAAGLLDVLEGVADFPAVLPPFDFAAPDLPAVEPDLVDVLAVDLPAAADFPVAADLPADVDFPVVLDPVLAVDLVEPLVEAAPLLAAPPDLVLPADLLEVPAPACFTAISAAPLTAPLAAPFPTSAMALAACAATLPMVSPTVAPNPFSEFFLPVFDGADFFVADDDLAVDLDVADFFSGIVSLLFN